MKSTPPPRPRPAVRRRAGVPITAIGGQTIAFESGDYLQLNATRRLVALALVCVAATLAVEPAMVAVAGAEDLLTWTPPIANLAMYVVAGRVLLALLLAGIVFRTRHESA